MKTNLRRLAVARPVVLALVLTQLMFTVGVACGEPAADSSSTITVVTTTETTSSGTTASTASNPQVQGLLDELREAAAQASFPVYYLGVTHGDAALADVMLGGEGSSHGPLSVVIVYRNTDMQNLLVVDLSEYDPVVSPDLSKPLPDWTLVREVEIDGFTDAIYRGGSAANALHYVAQRGSTEINLAGHTSEGYMTEDELIEIARLLVPVL